MRRTKGQAAENRPSDVDEARTDTRASSLVVSPWSDSFVLVPRADNVRRAGDLLEWTYGTLMPDEFTLKPFAHSGLEGFLALSPPSDEDEQILGFAREWGPLGLYPLPTKTPDRWTREPLHVWRTYAQRAVAYLRIACRLRDRREDDAETDPPPGSRQHGDGRDEARDLDDWRSILSDEEYGARFFSDPTTLPEEILAGQLHREREAAGISLVFEWGKGVDSLQRYGIGRDLQMVEDGISRNAPGTPRLPVLTKMSLYPAGLEPGLAEFKRHLDYVRSPWQRSLPASVTAARIRMIENLYEDSKQPPSSPLEQRPSWLWSAVLMRVDALVSSGKNCALCAGCGRPVVEEVGSEQKARTPKWCKERDCIRKRNRLNDATFRGATARGPS